MGRRSPESNMIWVNDISGLCLNFYPFLLFCFTSPGVWGCLQFLVLRARWNISTKWAMMRQRVFLDMDVRVWLLST